MIRFLETMYAGHPWYTGGVWGNVFVIPIAAGLGWLWSRTKFWPLRPIKHGLEHLHVKVDEFRQEHREAHEKLHRKLDRHAELHRAHRDEFKTVHEKLDKLLEDK
ncbi:MAG TPA: hypothetical protein VMT20_07130 [Terriglobia bacterium]|nr:hypothetical protein [Terriglobia bacterium]